jgi:UPF0755 protein
METFLSKKRIWVVASLSIVVIALAVTTVVVEPPLSTLFSFRNSQANIFNVQSGETISSLAAELKKDRIITSSFALRAMTKIVFGGDSLAAGEYQFRSAETLPVVAWRLSHADFGIPQQEVVIPEGSNIYQIAAIIKQKYPAFDATTFLNEAKNKEGYLFPDTYHFPPGVTPAEVIQTMSGTFNQQVAPLLAEIKASGYSENDIITMASILEGEVQSDADQKIVAGILWKRIAEGIRLQVDSTLTYETGKTSAELTAADLESDSPYNTYTHYGLPPGPISNPGLESIEAALHPTATDYMYFLADDNGNIHYAVTFEEHVANKKKYLN